MDHLRSRKERGAHGDSALQRILERLAEAVVKAQGRESGLWPTDLSRPPSEENPLETMTIQQTYQQARTWLEERARDA